MNAAAHSHGILIYYVTLESQRAQLARAGFRPDAEAFESTNGRRVGEADDTSQAWWFHFIARK